MAQQASVAGVSSGHPATRLDQRQEGFQDGLRDGRARIDSTLEVHAECGEPDGCEYCAGYSDGQAAADDEVA